MPGKIRYDDNKQKKIVANDAGGCSITMLTGMAYVYDKKRWKQELKDAIEGRTGYDEPHNFLAYVREDSEGAKLAEQFGFITVADLPGGHANYNMKLMVYMHKPEMFTKDFPE